jgi:hypothetical protein
MAAPELPSRIEPTSEQEELVLEANTMQERLDGFAPLAGLVEPSA